MSPKVLMTAEDMLRVLARVAHEIIENNRGVTDVVLVGMKTRGLPLAQRLQRLILQFGGVEVPVEALDIRRYRDDVDEVARPGPASSRATGGGITDKNVVLVDDVLYTGRSIRAAMDALIDSGRPRRIQLAVLVDRGHRELPVRADYVGKNVPSARHEEIRVHVQEVDGEDVVMLIALPEEQPVGGTAARKTR